MITVGIGIYQNDETQQALARAGGFAPVTTTSDWAKVRVAYLDGEPVAMVHTVLAIDVWQACSPTS